MSFTHIIMSLTFTFYDGIDTDKSGRAIKNEMAERITTTKICAQDVPSKEPPNSFRQTPLTLPLSRILGPSL